MLPTFLPAAPVKGEGVGLVEVPEVEAEAVL